MQYSQFTKLLTPGEYEAVLKHISLTPTGSLDVEFDVYDEAGEPTRLPTALPLGSDSWPRIVETLQWASADAVRFRVWVDEARQVSRTMVDEWCEVTEVLGVVGQHPTNHAGISHDSARGPCDTEILVEPSPPCRSSSPTRPWLGRPR